MIRVTGLRFLFVGPVDSRAPAAQSPELRCEIPALYQRRTARAPGVGKPAAAQPPLGAKIRHATGSESACRPVRPQSRSGPATGRLESAPPRSESGPGAGPRSNDPGPPGCAAAIAKEATRTGGRARVGGGRTRAAHRDPSLSWREATKAAGPGPGLPGCVPIAMDSDGGLGGAGGWGPGQSRPRARGSGGTRSP